jgi:hypothetical protein
MTIGPDTTPRTAHYIRHAKKPEVKQRKLRPARKRGAKLPSAFNFAKLTIDTSPSPTPPMSPALTPTSSTPTATADDAAASFSAVVDALSTPRRKRKRSRDSVLEVEEEEDEESEEMSHEQMKLCYQHSQKKLKLLKDDNERLAREVAVTRKTHLDFSAMQDQLSELQSSSAGAALVGSRTLDMVEGVVAKEKAVDEMRRATDDAIVVHKEGVRVSFFKNKASPVDASLYVSLEAGVPTVSVTDPKGSTIIKEIFSKLVLSQDPARNQGIIIKMKTKSKNAWTVIFDSDADRKRFVDYIAMLEKTEAGRDIDLPSKKQVAAQVKKLDEDSPPWTQIMNPLKKRVVALVAENNGSLIHPNPFMRTDAQQQVIMDGIAALQADCKSKPDLSEPDLVDINVVIFLFFFGFAQSSVEQVYLSSKKCKSTISKDTAVTNFRQFLMDHEDFDTRKSRTNLMRLDQVHAAYKLLCALCKPS